MQTDDERRTDVYLSPHEMTAEFVRDNPETVLCVLTELVARHSEPVRVSEYSAKLQGFRLLYGFDKKQAHVVLRIDDAQT